MENGLFLTDGLKETKFSTASGSNSAVECKLPKLDVEGSTPFSRFVVFCN